MIRFLYSAILLIGTPLILLRLYLRGIKSPGYRSRIGERFGAFLPPPNFASAKTTYWIHAVSVGETVAAAPLVSAIQKAYPEAQLLFTTMTPTGAERAKALFGTKVFHSYLPYDLPFAIHKFLARTQPDLLIVMETELWPNLLHLCKRQGVKLLLANARLSAKSAAGYARFSGTTNSMLQSFNAIAAQSREDAERLIALGADDSQLKVTGSLKFNVEQPPNEVSSDTFFAGIIASGRTVIIAASTREGEEKHVLNAFQTILKHDPSVLLLIVPRHPERFDEVVQMGQAMALNTIRRSAAPRQNFSLPTEVQLIIGDSMGEMNSYYSLADIAFVGGSLVDTGCQNVVEPAALALPILVGPSQFNFQQICNQLESVGGLKTIANANELAKVIIELLDDAQHRQAMGEAGRSVVEANQQALPALMEIIETLVKNAK